MTLMISLCHACQVTYKSDGVNGVVAWGWGSFWKHSPSSHVTPRRFRHVLSREIESLGNSDVTGLR